MSPSASFPCSDSRLKWKKRKRDSALKTPSKKQKPYADDEEDEDEEDDDEAAAEYDDVNEENGSPAPPDSDLGQAEVLSDAAVRISDFPPVVRRAVNRLHSSVVAVVAAERGAASASRSLPALENISHGHLQAVCVMPAECPSNAASGELERSDGNWPAFVCTPPPIMEGRGVIKEFPNCGRHVVPMHSDWFSPNKVNRLERQAVPHFFSGKSSDHTPERYMQLRNRIVSKYLENPSTRISPAYCQNLIKDYEAHDLHRIIRFLDNWGIINYMAVSLPSQSQLVGSVVQEDMNGDLQVPSVALRSLDSLIFFDQPKCKYRAEDVCSSSSIGSRSSESDLDTRIRDCLCETHCNYCLKALPHSYYQSWKDVDVTLCLDCYHDGKFVANHASIDFTKVETGNDHSDTDGDSWSDQETLLLLEAVDIYRESWNEIAEYVGTKSKAQCISHFIRLPMEDGLVESVRMAVSSDVAKEEGYGEPYPNANEGSEGLSSRSPTHEDRIPFEKSGNPVMALVAFLASAVRPRIAASCAHAALASLFVDDRYSQLEASVHGDRLTCEGMHKEDSQSSAPLSAEKVKAAARHGLSAAATKAKLFADHEEREIQRLSATIINHKLKRLELKLKEFAEVESLLIKECEQVERTRQRISAERARLMSNQFGALGGPAQPRVMPSTSNMNAMNQTSSNNNRQQFMPSAAGGGLPNVSASSFGGNNTLQQMHPHPHPHMSFMPRQPMFSFGPRMTVPGINPSASLSSSGPPLGPNTLSRPPSSGQTTTNLN